MTREKLLNAEKNNLAISGKSEAQNQFTYFIQLTYH